MDKKKFYVTTAIDYVNAPPHQGHAFEKIIADALARWHRLKGEDVFFITGVDENAQKNVLAAEKAGISVREFVNKNAKLFLNLCKLLNISYDKFIRTTAKEHALVVHEVLRKIIDNGDIYKGEYEGYYCTGCETYITEKNLIDGKCPEHNKEPEHMKEEAYFFKLSKYKNKLIKFVEGYIIPESKKKEILSRLKGKLNDVCISRKNAGWGIDFPDDKNFKVWVWIDALINYISGAKDKWPADVHVIGKGINWFHSVIWPGILMSADYELPDKLLVHGYVNLGGKKASKSLGNVIDPIKLADKYGADAVRYSLLRGSVFDDFDYSEEILIERYNNELANKLGNLVSRVSALAEKIEIEKFDNKVNLYKEWKRLIKEGKAEIEVSENSEIKDESSHVLKIKGQRDIKRGEPFPRILSEHPEQFCEATKLFIERHLDNYEFDKALNEIFRFIDHCNWYVQIRKLWENKDRDKRNLSELVESIRKITPYLGIFIPETAKEIEKIFKTNKIKKTKPLFKKIK